MRYGDIDKTWKLFPHMKLEANWGYESNKDLTYWKAQICEKCVDEKFKPIINLNWQFNWYLLGYVIDKLKCLCYVLTMEENNIYINKQFAIGQ